MTNSLPVGEAVSHLLQAGEALMEAHAAGVIHRDLKPANLFLTTGPRGEACLKVLDFGIAKLIGGPDPSEEQTATSSLVGTPSYMSPEQMRGQSIDARCDVWALGVILYRMVAGKVPFPGALANEVWGAVLLNEPEPPRALRPELPEELQAVILRCLRKDPNERFASVAELCQALAPFAGDGSAPASFARTSSAPALSAEGARVSSPEGSTAPPWQQGKLADAASPRRKPAPWLALLVVAVGGAGAFAGIAVHSFATGPAAATAETDHLVAAVTGAVLGGVFGSNATRHWDAALARCGGDPARCGARGLELGRAAKSDATIATVAFVAAGALLAGGVVLWVTAPSGKPPAAKAGLWLAPVVAPGSAGAAAGGRF